MTSPAGRGSRAGRSRTGTRTQRQTAKRETPADKPPARAELRILESQVFRGPNYWSYEPAVRLLVDLGSLEHWPSNTLPGFNEALLRSLPGLAQHSCSLGRPGGFVERLREGKVYPPEQARRFGTPLYVYSADQMVALSASHAHDAFRSRQNRSTDCANPSAA